MSIFRADGTVYRGDEDSPFRKADPKHCNHGVTFDVEEAERVLGDWQPSSAAEFVMGNPAAAEIRKRWPRLAGPCPYRCGYVGIYYASYEHYVMGDW